VDHAGRDLGGGAGGAGTVALGSLDDLDFLHPVRVGEIAILRAQVEYVGRSSLEVGVRVWSENVATGERAVTLNSHLVFVKVGVDGRPRPVADKIRPRDRAEQDLVEAARRRREARLVRFAKKVERGEGVDDEGGTSGAVRVGPERLARGRALWPDDVRGQAAEGHRRGRGILSMRYCRGFVMTACLDALDFYAPVATHEVVTFRAGLNHVGTSSLEIGVKVLAEVPWTGEVRHACTAYLTFVHLGPDRRPRPCPPSRRRRPASGDAGGRARPARGAAGAREAAPASLASDPEAAGAPATES